MLLQRRSNAISCLSITTALGLTVLTVVAQTPTAIKIDSVADKYALQDFSFEVSPETGRAGIRLEYTYPPARLGGDDSDRGPAPKIATLPGLTYDSTAHAVIYDGGTKRTTCATAADRRMLFWKSIYMKPTGACLVLSRLTPHAEDNGWSVDRFRTLDTYFEVAGK